MLAYHAFFSTIKVNIFSTPGVFAANGYEVVYPVRAENIRSKRDVNTDDKGMQESFFCRICITRCDKYSSINLGHLKLQGPSKKVDSHNSITC